jgi:RNA polymerase sigma-70 factor (ECF subfamily)
VGDGSTDLPDFDRVYQECFDRVYRFCLWLVRDPAFAQDLASETFLKGFEAYHRRRPDLAQDLASETFLKGFEAYHRRRPDPATVHVWLFAIARNLASSHRRRKRRWNRVFDRLIGSRPPDPDTETMANLSAELARALRLLGTMKERDQQLIAFHVAGELTLREIGDLLGVSENAATVATHRALERIRKLSEVAP